MSKQLRIGISGLIGAGKTTLALNLLTIFRKEYQQYNTIVYSFSYPVKNIIYRIFKTINKNEIVTITDYKEIVDLVYNKLKIPKDYLYKTLHYYLPLNQQFTIRQVLQLFATEVCRNYDPDFAIKQMLNNTEHADIVIIDDLRFLNEYKSCNKTIRLIADNLHKDSHISENELTDDLDYTLKLYRKEHEYFKLHDNTKITIKDIAHILINNFNQ